MRIAAIIIALILPAVVSAADTPASPEQKKSPPAAIAAQPAAPAAAAVPAVRIGYVDIVRIATESELGKSLKARLTDKKDKLQAKVLAKRKQLDKYKESIEAKLPGMSQQQREAKGKEFQKKVDELQKLARSAEEEFAKLQESETGELFAEIEKAASAYGKANGFALVVIKKELLYVGENIAPHDLTELLLKQINAPSRTK